MIKQYEKNGKKFYKFRNIYIGIDPTTGKEIRKSKSGFTSKRETEIYIYQIYVQNLIIKITSTAMILVFKNYMNYGFKDIKIQSNLVHFMLLKTC